MAGWAGPVQTSSADTLVKALQEVGQAIGKASEYVGALITEGQVTQGLDKGLLNEGASPEEARQFASQVRRILLGFIEQAGHAQKDAETAASMVQEGYVERIHELRAARKSSNGGLKV